MRAESARPDRAVTVWSQSVEVRGDLVSYEVRYRFRDTGEELVSHNELRFRSQEELTSSLREAGFRLRDVHGNIDRRPAGTGPELLFIAVR